MGVEVGGNDSNVILEPRLYDIPHCPYHPHWACQGKVPDDELVPVPSQYSTRNEQRNLTAAGPFPETMGILHPDASSWAR